MTEDLEVDQKVTGRIDLNYVIKLDEIKQNIDIAILFVDRSFAISFHLWFSSCMKYSIHYFMHPCQHLNVPQNEN